MRQLERLLSAGLLALVVAAPASAQSYLKSRIDLEVGDHPVQVIAGDFDGDGFLDLVSVDRLSSSLSLMKGFGDGTFRRIASLPTGTYPGGAVLADFNNDGLLDLATGNFLSQDVTVMLGNGLGGFGAKISTPASTTGAGIVAGDWNLDGKKDVAVIDSNNNRLSILLGTGTGTFGSPSLITVGTRPQAAAVADFNADGKADIAVANNGSGNVQVWRGNGTGGFTLANTLSTGTGSGPFAVVAADFNVDGRPDIAVSDNLAGGCGGLQGDVKVFLATTTGTFGAAKIACPGDGPRGIAAADLNNDSKLDLIVGLSQQTGTGKVAVMNGDNAGNFGAPVTAATGPLPGSLAVGDFNLDGSLDVAATSLTGATLSLLSNNAAGGFVVAGVIPLTCTTGSACSPTAIVSGDFNNDTKPDVAVVNAADESVGLILGDGLGGFGAMVTTSTGVNSGPSYAATLDENRDGKLDVVTANEYCDEVTGICTDTVNYFQNNGAGGFTSPPHITVAACDGVQGIATGEISGDLYADVVTVCQTSGHMCTLRGTGSANPNLAFGPAQCTILDPNVPVSSISPGGVALGQFNFDAFADIAITSTLQDWVYIGFSNGTGGFGDVPGNFAVQRVPLGIARGDLNNDGYDDLVIVNTASASISALLGDGGGVFSFPPPNSPVGQGPSAVALADFNLDGKLDAAVVNTNSNDVSLLLGDGLGHFSKAGVYGTRDMPTSIAVGDFNKDGKPDIAVTDLFSDTVTILRNQTVLQDPLAIATLFGNKLTVYRWGIVPGASYDAIRGETNTVTKLFTAIDLGPVTCLANDIIENDTAAYPDTVMPAVNHAFFYVIRTKIGGSLGPYTVATDGRVGTPSSGDCPE